MCFLDCGLDVHVLAAASGGLSGGIREGLRIGSHGIGSHGGHGVVLAATEQAAGAFPGCYAPARWVLIIPVLPVLGLLYAWMYRVSRIYVGNSSTVRIMSSVARMHPSPTPSSSRAERHLCKQAPITFTISTVLSSPCCFLFVGSRRTLRVASTTR